MMTRNTKKGQTNRQRHDTGNFPKFRFTLEWLEYIEAIADEDEQLKLFCAVSDYGIKHTPPKGLQPEHEEYFNREIRPELDRQHRRLKECKRI